MTPHEIKEMFGLFKIADDEFIVYTEAGYRRAVHLYHTALSGGRIYHVTHEETIALVPEECRTIRSYPSLVIFSGCKEYFLPYVQDVNAIREKRAFLDGELTKLIDQMEIQP